MLNLTLLALEAQLQLVPSSSRPQQLNLLCAVPAAWMPRAVRGDARRVESGRGEDVTVKLSCGYSLVKGLRNPNDGGKRGGECISHLLSASPLH